MLFAVSAARAQLSFFRAPFIVLLVALLPISGAAYSAAETPVTLDSSVSTTSQYSLSNGNLAFTYVSSGTSNRGGIPATDAVSSGKWYWEQTIDANNGSNAWVGLLAPSSSNWKPTSDSQRMDKQNNVYMFKQSGAVYVGTGGNRTVIETLNTWDQGDVIGIAFDADNGALWVSINGNWQNGATQAEIEGGDTSGALASNISGTNLAFAGSVNGHSGQSQTVTFNFAADSFVYGAPAGFEPYARPSASPDPSPAPTEGGSANGPTVITYQYDVQNRLKVVNYLNTGTQFVYRYDASGNRTSKALKGIDIPEAKVLSARALEGSAIVHDVWLTEIPLTDITIDWEITPGSASNPEDYTATSGTLNVAAGERVPQITISTETDTDVEGDETYTITLTAADGATIVEGDMDSATGTIGDDDVVYFQVQSVRASVEGAIVPVVISKVGSHTADIAVAVAGSSTAHPTGTEATAGLDFEAGLYSDSAATQPIASSIVFSSVDSAKTVYVKTLDDSEYEGEETFQVGANWTVDEKENSAVGTITIPDNEAPRPPSFSVEDVSAMEGDDLVFVVRKSATTEESFSVEYAAVGGTGVTDATDDEDFEPITGILDFAGSREGEVWTKTIRVTTEDDNDFEQAENVYLNLSSATYGSSITTPQAIGRIENNDGTPIVNVFNSSVTEGDDGQDPTLTVTIFLAGGAQQDVTLTYYSEDIEGGATADVDYVSVPDTTVTIPAGEYEYNFDVTILSDTEYEGDETFQINVKNLTNAVATDFENPDESKRNVIPQNPEKETPGIMTIREDDPGLPGFSVLDASAKEGDNFITFTITKSISVAGDYSVTYATAAATGKVDAAAESEFTSTTGELLFRGEDFGTEDMSLEVQVPISDDTVFEQAEVFYLMLSSPSEGSEILDEQGIGTIENDDGQPFVNVFNGSVTEGHSGEKEVPVTIFLAGGAQQDVTLTYYTEDITGGATAGVDYVPVPDTEVTIPAGEYETTFNVTILGDIDIEGDETFAVKVKDPVNARLALVGDIPQNPDKATPATITIKDDDDGSVPMFNVSDVSAKEGEPLYFVVTRTGLMTGTFSVDYATSSGTAESDDYTSIVGELEFADNEASKTVTVYTGDDDDYEPSNAGTDTVLLTLSNASAGAYIGDDVAVGTITDSMDAAPAIYINKADAVEGNGVVFGIRLSNASELTHSVDYSTQDGGATADDGDYTPISGTVTFAPGNVVMRRTVQTTDDNKYEGDQTFSLKVQNPTNGATISEGEQEATILENDSPTTASFSVSDASVTEGGVLSFTVTRSGLMTGSYSVDYATSNDTAESDDYTSAVGQLNFADGDPSKTVSVQTTDDDIYEPSDGGVDLIKLTLSNATGGAVIPDNVGIGTITNSTDTAPAMYINKANAVEGEQLTFGIRMTNKSELDHDVTFATSNGSASSADYTAKSGTHTFTAGGSDVRNVLIDTVDDTVYVGDRTVYLNISNASNGATIQESSQDATILENDPVPPPSFSVSGDSVAEGGDLEFTVTRSGSSVGSYSLDYATSNDTAEANDYTSASGQLTFADGVMSQTITVQTTHDLRYEPSNSGTDKLWLTLSNPSGGATISGATAVGTITNSTDSAPSISMSESNATEGGNIVFTVTLSNSSEQSHSVNYATSGGSASANDYTSKSGTLTFAAGQTSKTISVATTQDAYFESDETVKMTLSSATNSATISTANKTATINNDDAAPTFKVNNVSTMEGNSVTFTLTRTGYTWRPHYMNYATQNGSAKAGTDYTAKSGQTAWAVNDNYTFTKTITVSTIENMIEDGNRTFYLKLSNITAGGVISDNSGTATIEDDDGLLN